MRLRGFGIYSYHINRCQESFYTKISGTRDIYRVADLEGQLRNTIVAKMTDTFAASQVPFLDMAANQGALADKIAEQLQAGVRRLRPDARYFRGGESFAARRACRKFSISASA